MRQAFSAFKQRTSLKPAFTKSAVARDGDENQPVPVRLFSPPQKPSQQAATHLPFTTGRGNKQRAPISTRKASFRAHQGGNNVKVIVRVRPQSGQERSQSGSGCLRTTGSCVVVLDSNIPKQYTFDEVIAGAGDQQAAYQAAGREAVDSLLQGYNACIMAYGQTGSGKTHTMLGPAGTGLDDEGRGLVPRVLESTLLGLQERKETAEAEGGSYDAAVMCRVLEVYNEQVRDLYTSAEVTLQGCGAGFVTRAATVHQIRSAEEGLHVLQHCLANREVSATAINDASSRSHLILLCDINTTANGISHTRRLCLVDLAGSERRKQSGGEGKQQEEACHINQSLGHLKEVVGALVEGQSFIPYRRSKLTRLLEDCLGGNCKTVIVATLSAAACHKEETLSTLRFANEAKQLPNQPVVNEGKINDPVALQQKVQTLEAELVAAHEGRAAEKRELDGYVTSLQQQVSDLERLVGDLQDELSQACSQASKQQEVGAYVADLEAGCNQLVQGLLPRHQELLHARADLERERDQLQAMLLSLREELERLQLAHEDLQEECDHHRLLTQDLERASDDLERQVHTTQQALAQQAEQHQAAAGAWSHERQQHQAAAAAWLQDMQQLRAAEQAAREHGQQQQAELDAAVFTLGRLQSENFQLQAQLTAKSSEALELRSEAYQQQREQEEQEQRLQALQEQVAVLQGELASCQAREADLAAQLVTAQQAQQEADEVADVASCGSPDVQHERQQPQQPQHVGICTYRSSPEVQQVKQQQQVHQQQQQQQQRELQQLHATVQNTPEQAQRTPGQKLLGSLRMLGLLGAPLLRESYTPDCQPQQQQPQLQQHHETQQQPEEGQEQQQERMQRLRREQCLEESRLQEQEPLVSEAVEAEGTACVAAEEGICAADGQEEERGPSQESTAAGKLASSQDVRTAACSPTTPAAGGFVEVPPSRKAVDGKLLMAKRPAPAAAAAAGQEPGAPHSSRPESQPDATDSGEQVRAPEAASLSTAPHKETALVEPSSPDIASCSCHPTPGTVETGAAAAAAPSKAAGRTHRAAAAAAAAKASAPAPHGAGLFSSLPDRVVFHHPDVRNAEGKPREYILDAAGQVHPRTGGFRKAIKKWAKDNRLKADWPSEVLVGSTGLSLQAFCSRAVLPGLCHLCGLNPPNNNAAVHPEGLPQLKLCDVCLECLDPPSWGDDRIWRYEIDGLDCFCRCCGNITPATRLLPVRQGTKGGGTPTELVYCVQPECQRAWCNGYIFNFTNDDAAAMGKDAWHNWLCPKCQPRGEPTVGGRQFLVLREQQPAGQQQQPAGEQLEAGVQQQQQHTSAAWQDATSPAGSDPFQHSGNAAGTVTAAAAEAVAAGVPAGTAGAPALEGPGSLPMRPWKAGWLPAGVSQSTSQRHQAPSRNQGSKAAAASSARQNDSSQELVATGAPDAAASQQRSLSQAAPTAAATAAASAPAQPEQQQQQLVVAADGAQPGQPPPAGRGLLGAPGRFALQRAGDDGAAAAPKRVRKLLPATRSAGDDEEALTPLAAGPSRAQQRSLHIRRDYGGAILKGAAGSLAPSQGHNKALPLSGQQARAALQELDTNRKLGD